MAGAGRSAPGNRPSAFLTSREDDEMRILSMLVRHGTDKYPGAIDDISGLFARQLPEAEWDLIVIDNAQPDGYERGLGPRRVLIGSSNVMWEFSAWQSGLAFVGHR